MTDSDQTHERASIFNEKVGNFWNARGEAIDPTLRLFVDSERGSTWRRYAEATMPREVLPREVFAKFGLIDNPDSVEWINVVEHSMAVAAAAVDLAYRLKEEGLDVDIDLVERAAWVHDASKRLDIVSVISREDEASDTVLERVLAENGYTPAEIAAAKNTGRLADRYITDAEQRLQKIEQRSLEENIVGYADARMRGSSLEDLGKARDDSISKKPKDLIFFRDNWYPYYKAVEGYFVTLAPGVDLAALNNDSIYTAIQRRLAGESHNVERKYFQIDSYTAPKAGNDPELNEDVVRYADNIIALADGTTGKPKELADRVKETFGVSGGRLAAEVAVSEAMTAQVDGAELIDSICKRIDELCENNTQEIPGIGQALAATIAVARMDYDTNELVITRVGDTGARVVLKDGTTYMLMEQKEIDKTDARNRARVIQQALAKGIEYQNAIKQGREAILESLVNTAPLRRNNPNIKDGFGCLATGKVPDKFIKVSRFPLYDVETVELMSDGYLYAPQDEFPENASIKEWEEHIQRVHAEDPDKYLKYIATKPSDDRTIIVARIA